MLAHGAGVDEHHGGFIGVFGLEDAARLQMASHLVGIRDIHLAPVGAHVILHKLEHYTCGMHEVPIEDSIDLHTFQPREIAMVVEEYLYQAVAKGFREVRIIHGRGIGVQREIVRAHSGEASRTCSPSTTPPTADRRRWFWLGKGMEHYLQSVLSLAISVVPNCRISASLARILKRRLAAKRRMRGSQ